MNFFNLNVADAITVWDGVKSRIEKTIIAKPKENDGLDYSYITPSILALAKFHDNKIEELSQILQQQEFLLWNLSGKPFSAAAKDALNFQILEPPWLTPGQFTQAPSLECLFAQCQSIKTWLDLDSNHVAIVHCANGRSRSGILIACLLKIMGAFEQSSHAFDFFCSARSQTDIKPTLAPSYRILFENIDEAVNHGSYPNVSKLHLKCIAVSGLPVDEIPCVEIWDTTGLIFNSHNGMKSTNKCTWSSEYGDGFFRVTQDILGDFSVMCRFGGSHALTRDKTTLIFKYQNSTAFLPSEVIELKRQNVDINPEYSDSLDNELFTVHLMFEKPQGKDGKSLPYRSFNGKISSGYFETGLCEISKHHIQEPNTLKCSTLIDMGYPEKYVPVALQFGNNVTDNAARYLQKMKSRQFHILNAINETPKKQPLVISTIKESMPENFQPPTIPLLNSNNVATNIECNSIEGKENIICSICNEDNPMKKDQLVPCTYCLNEFHTTCFGARRIPFTLKTVKEKQNREKFIKKHYSDWRCASCSSNDSNSDNRERLSSARSDDVIKSSPKRQLSPLPTDVVPPNYSQAWKPTLTNNGDVSYYKGIDDNDDTIEHQTTNHDQAAFLIGVLAASGYNVENLMMLSSDKQREALIDATNHYNSKISTPIKTITPVHGRYIDSNHNPSLSSLTNRSLTVKSESITNDSSKCENTKENNNNNIEPLKSDVSSDTKLLKYKKMVQVGIGKSSVAQKMMTDNVINNIDEGIKILDSFDSVPQKSDKQPDEMQISNLENISKPLIVEEKLTEVPVSEHPMYSKFFKMIKMGVDINAVKKKMTDDGLDCTILDKLPNELIPLNENKEEAKKIALSEHPVYGKYFKMLRAGVQKDAIQNKMKSEGCNPEYLDMPLSELVPVEPINDEPKPALKNIFTANTFNKKTEKQKVVVRKKRLHWKALDASKVGDNTLWANDQDDDIKLDEDEFNQLFVDKGDQQSHNIDVSNKEITKKKRINIIDMKRAQNGGISLARIKLSFEEVRLKIQNMEDEFFTTDQLVSLSEFLPTNDEVQLLKAYNGDVDLLGPAERYMIVMFNFSSAADRIRCMIYKQQFKGRVHECKTILAKIETACDDVKLSIKLKKVLKTILKVGNQMNDGEEHVGFTLDSLLKLQSAKAFDKKTSILQYVIMLIQRNDETILQFPSEMSNISEASRLILDSVNVEALQLRQGLDNACKVISALKQTESCDMSTMAAFLYKATEKCDHLDTSIEKVKSKYASVLSYFGEESTMQSHDFFSTLFKFIQEFIVTRDAVLRKAKSTKAQITKSESNSVLESTKSVDCVT